MNWRVETNEAEAEFNRSREQQIWGSSVGRLAYHSSNNNPVIIIRPEIPIQLPENGYDAVSCWIYGNQWGWMSGPKIIIPIIELLFKLPDGSEKSIEFSRVNWKEWNKVIIRFTDKDLKDLRQKGTCFNGFRIYNTRNTDERLLYFDNLSFYKEVFKPLTFQERPKRGIDMFPGQPTGVHTGQGRLPFPTREETILPDCAVKGSKNETFEKNGSFFMKYTGSDGELAAEYNPQSGTWSDLSVSWNGCEKFYPADKGGITVITGKEDQEEPVLSSKLLKVKIDGQKIIAQWLFKSASSETTGEYHWSMSGKSIILDVFSQGGKTAKIDFGQLSSIRTGKQIAVPYYTYIYGGVNRPFALVFEQNGTPNPLFMMVHSDWYRSNASSLQGVRNDDLVNNMGNSPVTLKANGSIGYLPKTDGKRNDVYERIFIAISPKFEETLPVIANPPSPYKNVVGTRIWYSRGAALDRRIDYEYWEKYHRAGLTRMLVTDHEVGWRREGESFTFRTKPDPYKGGDKGQNDFARFMIDKLGYVYGPYNNFMDFAPINEFWDPDLVIRTADNQLQKSWPRCYGPKAARAVEFSEKLVPEIQKKFHFNTGYCDVHTAVPPWGRVDYDSRVPGAGTYAANFYSWGELFLVQKRDWNGPVFSEGPINFLYSGLTDGNYAQDQGYHFVENPWLVDFDLLKCHDLECNYGMGKIYMFEPAIRGTGKVIKPEEQNYYLDRYLAACFAFGHTGYFVPDFGRSGAYRSYFMIQAAAARFTQSSVDSIRYAGPDGQLYDTSAALASDLYKRSQLVVRYKDGTAVAVNGSNTEPMLVKDRTGKMIRVTPNGYLVWTKQGDLLIESFNRFGFRFDYADTPEYLYFDGRGHWQTRENACGNGQGYCLKQKDRKYEMFLLGGQTGFRLDADKATALDFERKPIGPAKIIQSRGYLFVEPVPNAVSYLLEKTDGQGTKEKIFGSGIPVAVLPGDKIETTGTVIPRWCGPGTVYWDRPNNLFFQVARFSWIQTDLRGQNLLSVRSINLMTPGQSMDVSVSFNGKYLKRESERKLTGDFYEQEDLFRLETPQATGTDKIFVYVKGNDRLERWEYLLETDQEYRRWNVSLSPVSASSGQSALTPEKWLQKRGKAPVQEFENTGAAAVYYKKMMTDSIPKDGYFLHPPYIKGVGSVWLEYELSVPFFDGYGTAFRCEVGKKDKSTPGDGFLCQIKVVAENGKEETLTQCHIADYKWHPLEADLSAYRGKKIRLRLLCDVGSANNSIADQSQWADPRIESLRMTFTRKLSDIVK